MPVATPTRSTHQQMRSEYNLDLTPDLKRETNLRKSSWQYDSNENRDGIYFNFNLLYF